MGFGFVPGGVRLRARLALEAWAGRLAVRRRNEFDRSARRFRTSERRGPAGRLGTMSLGGAVMILGERLEPSRGRTVLFMLRSSKSARSRSSLRSQSWERGPRRSSFGHLQWRALAPSSAAQGRRRPPSSSSGFGAKLGLLPFYEWFPGAYGSGSGASGRDHLGRRPQRRLLRPVAGSVQLASRPARRRFPAALGHRHRGRDAQRNPDHPLCVPAGRLAQLC